MYIWHEVQSYPGFTDHMVLYRNVLVREINFVLSPRYAKIADSQKTSQDYDQIRNNRILLQQQMKESIKRNQVELSLIEEPLKFTQDTATAEVFLKYFQIPIEIIGQDIYYSMRKAGSPYQKVIEKREFSKAVEFLQFFPKEDADNEFITLFSTAAEQSLNRDLSLFYDLFRDERYKQLLKRDDMKKTLESAFVLAEEEKRLDDAVKIAELTGDQELFFRLKAIECLLARDAQGAVGYLQKVKNKERLKEPLIDAYWYEINEGVKDIQHYRNAFNYALYGELTEGEYKDYVQHPATELTRFLIAHDSTDEKGMAEIETFLPHVPPRTFRNLCANMFLRLIREDQTEKARALKHRFKVTFGRGEYDEEAKVLEYFVNLTETKGQFDLPKGEENLKTAFDVGELFELNRKDLEEVSFLLFKHYVTKKQYAHAKKLYAPGREDLTEFIESECNTLIARKQGREALVLVKTLNIKFSAASIRKQRAFLKEFILNPSRKKEDFVKAVIIEQVYDINLIPDYVYDQFIKECMRSPHAGTQLLVDLNRALIPRLSSSLLIALHEHIQKMQTSNQQLAQELQKAYQSVLPPGLLDYIFCYLLRLLHWD